MKRFEERVDWIGEEFFDWFWRLGFFGTAGSMVMFEGFQATGAVCSAVD